MANKTRRSVTLKRKMLYYTMAIILIMSMLSILSMSILNVYRGRIDEMFERNLMLKQIDDDLQRVDRELISYLSTKSSGSLNDYMFFEEELRNHLAEVTDGISSYTEEELLILDINSMTRSYLTTANQAIQDKRRSNVNAYTRNYEEASLVKGYIESYINELNIRQLDSNANNYTVMTEQIQRASLLNFVLILNLILLSVIIVLNMSESIIEPVVHLSHTAEEIAKGRFDTKEIIVETNDEIEILARAFNRMRRSIHAYIEELKEKAFTEALLKDQEMENLKMQALLDNARLYALQSQMNPHFLFNTINAAVQLSMIEGADKTSEFLETMSRLFRYNIRQLDEAVTLRQEMANISDYYELLKVRFGGLINFEFNVDEDLLDCMIPPLTLQPLVENAYIHGLSKKEEGGTIGITVKRQGESVMTVIADDGMGMNNERIHYIYESVNHEHRPEKTKSSNGIGMANVIERLELFYRKTNILVIDSEEGHGTSVIMALPYNKGVSNG